MTIWCYRAYTSICNFRKGRDLQTRTKGFFRS